MSEKQQESVFIELIGVSPEDIPHGDEWNGRSEDAATDLANDVHQLIQEDYPFEVEGVATCVSEDIHKWLNNARNIDDS